MNDTPQPSNLVPFARDAGFLRARARDHLRAGRMLEALDLYRMIAGREPGDAQGQMELAALYSDMCAYELSNRLLFAQAQRGEHRAACFFALGRNFCAMQDARRAQDCLLTALRLEPGGYFAEEAEALLDGLDEAVAPGPGAGRVDKAIRRGMQALETGRPDSAARWIGYALRKRGEDADTLTLLCFAHLNAGRPREGLRAARRAYRRDRHSVYALCAMASALFALDSPALCAKFLREAEAEAEYAQEIALLCQTACEVGAHDMALSLLRVVQAERPYVPSLLHMLAAACWNTGQARPAMRHWATLRRLDPGDLAAGVLYERAKKRVAQGEGDAQKPPLPEDQCAYGAELPPEDAIEKLLEVQQALRKGPEALQARFDEDAGFAAILAWGLTVRDENDATRGAMLSLLGSLQGERANRMLLALLTDTDQSEQIKREAIGLLTSRGLCGPHYMESGGRVLRVMGRALSLQAALPPNCERILQAAVDRLTPRYGDVVQDLSQIWLDFLRRRKDPGEPLKRPRLWVAALEGAYRARRRAQAGLEPMETERQCARRGISSRALRRRLRMLLQEEE
ncbi:MAG: hypothetical protein FWE77_00305 [Clostridia bacterium]|nr:hypothetical protein [Clostridia bacterium]